MDSSLFFGGSVVAAVIAGSIALFAPCCISVMLPAYFATAFQNRRLLVAITFLRTSDEEHRDAAAQQAPEPRKARPAEIVRREAVRVLGEVVELRTDEAPDPGGQRERIGQPGIELATAQLPRQQEAGRKRRQELADP